MYSQIYILLSLLHRPYTVCLVYPVSSPLKNIHYPNLVLLKYLSWCSLYLLSGPQLLIMCILRALSLSQPLVPSVLVTAASFAFLLPFTSPHQELTVQSPCAKRGTSSAKCPVLCILYESKKKYTYT